MKLGEARALLDLVADTVRERLRLADERVENIAEGLMKVHGGIAQLQKDCADSANARVRLGQKIDDQGAALSARLEAQIAQIDQLEAQIAQLCARVESLTACLASVTAQTRTKGANGKARAAPN